MDALLSRIERRTTVLLWMLGALNALALAELWLAWLVWRM
jgi:hypothetical protein